MKLSDKKPVGVRGDFIDDESFQKIWDDVCSWYDKNVDQLVDNIRQIYALTGNQCGYSVLTQNWDNFRQWKGVGDIQKFSNDDIRNNIIDKMYGPLCGLWHMSNYGPKHFNQAFTGLLVTFYLVVDKVPVSDGFKLHYSYELKMNIGSSVCKTL